MKCETSDKSNRTLLVSDIPGYDETLEITVGYTGPGSGYKAVPLDGQVIPAIKRGLNATEAVYVFLAPSSRLFNQGDPVVAVLGHEPTLEEQWQLLRAHVAKHYLEGEDEEQLCKLLDNWSGSDFELVRLPLLP